MPNYQLTYQQPYQYMDDDSKYGISWRVCTTIPFESSDDAEARSTVRAFLEDDIVIFDHPTDGDGKTYKRTLIRLTKHISMEKKPHLQDPPPPQNTNPQKKETIQ